MQKIDVAAFQKKKKDWCCNVTILGGASLSNCITPEYIWMVLIRCLSNRGNFKLMEIPKGHINKTYLNHVPNQ